MPKTNIERIMADKKFVYVSDFDNPATVRVVILKGCLPSAFFGANEQYYDCMFCWPMEALPELKRITEAGAVLKKALDDNMKQVYQLRNKIARGEL